MNNKHLFTVCSRNFKPFLLTAFLSFTLSAFAIPLGKIPVKTDIATSDDLSSATNHLSSTLLNTFTPFDWVSPGDWSIRVDAFQTNLTDIAVFFCTNWDGAILATNCSSPTWSVYYNLYRNSLDVENAYATNYLPVTWSIVGASNVAPRLDGNTLSITSGVSGVVTVEGFDSVLTRRRDLSFGVNGTFLADRQVMGYTTNSMLAELYLSLTNVDKRIAQGTNDTFHIGTWYFPWGNWTWNEDRLECDKLWNADGSWNTRCWLSPSLCCFTTYTNSTASWTLTAISEHVALCAHHWGLNISAARTWVLPDGTRTNIATVGRYRLREWLNNRGEADLSATVDNDIAVYITSSEVPEPCRAWVMDSSYWDARISTATYIPIFALTAHGEAMFGFSSTTIVPCGFIYSSISSKRLPPQYQSYVDLPFNHIGIAPDSGHPIFIVYHDRPILCGLFHYSSGGNSIMRALPGIKYFMSVMAPGDTLKEIKE